MKNYELFMFIYLFKKKIFKNLLFPFSYIFCLFLNIDPELKMGLDLFELGWKILRSSTWITQKQLLIN